MDRWIKASRRTSQPPTSIVQRRSPRSCGRARFHVRHGVTCVTQTLSCISQPRLRRNYAVGAAQQGPGFVDGGSSEVRSAVRKNAVPFAATSRSCGAGTSPAPAGCWAQWCAGRSRSSCGRAAVVREVHERTLRALVRLPRERRASRWKSSGLPCASFKFWPPLLQNARLLHHRWKITRQYTPGL